MLANNLNTFSDFKTIINSSRSKGRLHTKPNWTAYNRKNLSSIPSKIENIIIDVKTESINKGFLSNTKRFFKRNEGEKFNYPGPGSYNNATKDNKIYSSKGYGQFASGKQRFDEYSDYIKMYEPGPSDYILNHNNIKEKSNEVVKKGNNPKTKNFCLKEDFIGPGPGYYDTNKNVNNEQNLTNNFFFKSTSSRFIYKKEKNDKKKKIEEIIPNIQNITTSEFNINSNKTFFKDKFLLKGKDDLISGNNTNYNTFYTDTSKTKNSTFYPVITSYNNTIFKNFKKNSEKDKNIKEQIIYDNTENDIKLNKDITNINTSLNKNAKKDDEKYESHYNANLNLNNAKESALVKNNKTISFFFKSKCIQPKNPLLEIGIKVNENENINLISPGPGSYNIKRELIDDKEYKYKPYLEFLKYQRDASKQKIKPKPKKKKHKNKNDYYLTFTEFNVEKIKDKKSSAFLSKSPKLIKNQNDKPGPCYYSPQSKMNKTSFNSFVGKKWLN